MISQTQNTGYSKELVVPQPLTSNQLHALTLPYHNSH